MFGYIRPFKPQMRFCEYDIYRGVYCGLCKELGKSYGFWTRFTLSYDFAFLGLLGISLASADAGLEIKNERCIAHPFKKTPCLSCSENSENAKAIKLAAAAAYMSLYHKLSDDREDIGATGSFSTKMKSLVLMIVMRFMKGRYNKAVCMYPRLGAVMEESMQLQFSLEKERTESVDRAAEPTSTIIAAILEEISCSNMSEEKEASFKRILGRMGQMLGRYIYIVDALDDLKRDIKKNNYNPLALSCSSGNMTPDVFSGVDFQKAREEALCFFRLSMGELASAFVLLPVERYKTILENVIYQGLEHTFATVYHGKELPNERSI